MRKYILLIREIILFTNSLQFNLIVFSLSQKYRHIICVVQKSLKSGTEPFFWRILHYLFTPLQPQEKILNNVKMQSFVGCFAKYNWNFHLMLPFATLLETALTERYVSEYSVFLFWKKWIKTLIICDEAEAVRMEFGNRGYDNAKIPNWICRASLFLQKICV